MWLKNRLLHILLLASLAGALGACAAEPAAQPVQEPAIQLENCQLAVPGSNARFEATCGSLRVPENRAMPDGRQIDLFVAVLPAISRSPEPDPLFLLAGGPGQAASEAFAPAGVLFRSLNQERDIVLLDQRGTGRSHPLDCGIPQGAELELNTEFDTAGWLSECLATLEADPTQYTTATSVEDLEQVRSALGYEQINLLGVSYGTRMALSYMRSYPERVRSVVLDGVVPADMQILLDAASDAQQAIEQLFERCAADPACNQAFPQLRADFEQLLAAFENGPVAIELAHPITGETLQIPATRETIAGVVQTLSYSPATTALLPLLIHEAATSGDYSRLLAQSLMISDTLLSSQSLGLRFSVLCAEDQFYSTEEAAQRNANTYLGNSYTDSLREACAAWPHAQISADFKQPVVSDLPTLLLSGAYDPITPAYHAERAAETLGNSVHLLVPNLGHNTFTHPCILDIVNQFIETGSPANLPTGCVADVSADPFFVSYGGPRP